ncbi:hypothetical protein D3C76_1495840 [compost metagenome]
MNGIGYHADFFGHRLHGGIPWDTHHLHATVFQLLKHQRGLCQFGGQDQGGFQRQDTFGIQLAHIADVGQFLHRSRVQTGTVSCHNFIARAQREGNFGHVTAY